MIEGCKRQSPGKDTRLPITHNILKVLLHNLNFTCKTPYESVLYQTAFSLAYYALLRVGEFAAPSAYDTDRQIALTDIQISKYAIKVTIRFSKTDQKGKSAVLTIPAQADPSTCPLTLMKRYLGLRPTYHGILFIHLDLTPLTRYQVSTMLQTTLKLANIHHDQFKMHSFRIGRCSDLFRNQVPEDRIKEIGRWKSDAYKSYIRL